MDIKKEQSPSPSQTEPHQNTSILFKCEIPGRCYVKKTQRKVVGYGRCKRFIDTPVFKAWEQAAYLSLKQAIKKWPPQNFPISKYTKVQFVFYFENHMAEADGTALAEGPQDMLQEVGIFANDKFINPSIQFKCFGERPRTEITVFSGETLPEGT